jgi:hypothetical protein
MRNVLAGVAVCAVVVAAAGMSVAADQTGRYKRDGNKCLWDAKDTGPDQCEPVILAHFKKDGDNCNWVSGKGADECRPAKGRFKVDGNTCAWNATDTGPDQCDPRRAK